jgi:hypothetical protein
VEQLRKLEVADDLDLTFAQRFDVDQILHEALKQSIKTHASLKNASPAEWRAKDDEADGAMAEKVDALLNDKQRLRFRQIRIQHHGPIALTDSEIATTLGLSARQLKGIGRLLAAKEEAAAEAYKSHGGDVMKALPDVEKAVDTFASKAIAVLTPEQASRFDAMQGKKLDWAALNDWKKVH